MNASSIILFIKADSEKSDLLKSGSIVEHEAENAGVTFGSVSKNREIFHVNSMHWHTFEQNVLYEFSDVHST